MKNLLNFIYLSQVRRNVLSETKYVELAIVNDITQVDMQLISLLVCLRMMVFYSR